MKGDTQQTLVSNLPQVVIDRLDQARSRFGFVHPFVVSKLHFDRNNIDAVEGIQRFLRDSGLHDYTRDARSEVATSYVGIVGGEVVDRPFILPFYRSSSIRNDPRFSIHAPILRLARVDDCLVFAQRGDGSMVILNITRELPLMHPGGGRWLFLLRTADGFDVDSAVPKLRPIAQSAQGRLQDSILRRQIERYAVDVALDYYCRLGATHIEELGKPYDLRVWFGKDELRVEVKGSTNYIDRVLVTVNEVDHAHSFGNVDLFVVDGIARTGTSAAWDLSGGHVRRWGTWKPPASTLRALTFEHDIGVGVADNEFTLEDY